MWLAWDFFGGGGGHIYLLCVGGCVHACVHIWRQNVSVVCLHLLCSTLFFLRQGLSLNLDLIILARSAGHSNFKDQLVSPSKLWSYRWAQPHLALLWVPGIKLRSSASAASSPATKWEFCMRTTQPIMSVSPISVLFEPSYRRPRRLRQDEKGPEEKVQWPRSSSECQSPTCLKSTWVGRGHLSSYDWSLNDPDTSAELSYGQGHWSVLALIGGNSDRAKAAAPGFTAHGNPLRIIKKIWMSGSHH